jgi:hypothetical protein
MDKWPKTVKQRCKEPVPFLAKEIRIACIKDPRDVYRRQEGEPWEQFERRCEVVTLEARKSSEGPIITPLSTSEQNEEEGVAGDEGDGEHDLGRAAKPSEAHKSRAEPPAHNTPGDNVRSTDETPRPGHRGEESRAGTWGLFSVLRV